MPPEQHATLRPSRRRRRALKTLHRFLLVLHLLVPFLALFIRKAVGMLLSRLLRVRGGLHHLLLLDHDVLVTGA